MLWTYVAYIIDRHVLEMFCLNISQGISSPPLPRSKNVLGLFSLHDPSDGNSFLYHNSKTSRTQHDLFSRKTDNETEERNIMKILNVATEECNNFLFLKTKDLQQSRNIKSSHNLVCRVAFQG